MSVALAPALIGAAASIGGSLLNKPKKPSLPPPVPDVLAKPPEPVQTPSPVVDPSAVNQPKATQKSDKRVIDARKRVRKAASRSSSKQSVLAGETGGASGNKRTLLG